MMLKIALHMARKY
jgi:DNA invertase Pin-like site-specific DNA recombinase